MKISYILDKLVNEDVMETDIYNICYKPSDCKGEDLLFLFGQNAINEYLALLPKVAAIVTAIPFSSPNNEKIYTTKNVRSALSKAYARFYCKDISKIKFIGITGTNGKSTTAMMIERILCDQGIKVGFIGTGKIRIGDKALTPQYYSMTTPAPDLLYYAIGAMEKEGAEIIVMEVSSHALNQERVSPINFEIGIFTNLSEEHLDYHNSMEEYFLAKRKLCEKSKFIITNSDDNYGKKVIELYENSDGCGMNDEATVKFSNIKDFGFSGSEFVYASDFGEITIGIKLPGVYNIYNATLAIRAAEKLGISKENIERSLSKIDKIDGRFNIIKGSVTVVIDYAHTPSAFDNLLKSLYSSKNTEQNIFVVFGCGGERDKSKRSVFGEISERHAETIIVTSDNPRGESPISIIEDITKNMKNTPKIIVDRKEAIRYAILTARDNDIIAIVGKGPEKYIITNDVYSPFDEIEIIQDALQERLQCE